ncbi:toxin TcdB middle/N-terminal domain-containing protein [Derxia gummosa]|uniref:Toxin TcdB middle/N-terminal domain-containing protein n=1 Tax=Derxia gummosa DSM 723 TaxID=1121388 RepID=A0A8B6X7U5_9BURK|nr:toxin TcdB middle/N-terminal domain-containing protein [Derxia gummosa]
MAIDSGFASQAPSLPGGGRLGGLGETFSPDLSTGTGTFGIPLDVPNGPNDIGPKLALRYDSGAGNGPFGLGWTLALPRLLRSTMLGRPRYDASDTLILEGSGPLLRLPDGGLRPEVDTGDWRIEALGDGFRVTDRAGMRFELGTTDDSRIPGLGGGTWAWLLHAIEDNLGNVARFDWRAAGAQRYLDRVSWSLWHLAFVYEARPDPLSWGRGGFLLRTDERCSAIELHLDGADASLLRRWSLGYARGEPNGASWLASVALAGFDADGESLAAPPLSFGYTQPKAPALDRIGAVDDGALPPGLDGRGRVELVDWSGTGLPDLIEISAGGTARVWPNLGGRWDRPRAAGLVPQLASPMARAALVDLDGDGRADVVRVDEPLRGYQPRTADGFARPVDWDDAPSLALMSPDCRLADFDGDGAADLLWSNGRALMLATRAGNGDGGANGGGWQRRPTVVPATPDGPPVNLADPHVFCADMTGDGSPDLVRADGRGVTYWPHLGHGVFGDAVRMADAPALPFDTDASRLYLADLDGDGCAELIQLADGVVRWWPNRAGAGFEPPREIAHVPTGAMGELRIADLRGDGTPALCWSAPTTSGRARWYALAPLGGARCGLLESIDNGCGRHTEIRWSNSAIEAARDRVLGKPWATRLPVVIPVVGEIEVTDVGGATETTRLRYHDGRYDGVLREVCGFGRVEQEDAGDDSVATLHTQRWFHHGANIDGSEPATTDERRRLRAIRGRLRRQDRRDDHGKLLDRLEQRWEVADGAVEGTVVPRLRSTVRSSFEGANTAFSRIVSEQLAWDADGNVTKARERSYRGNATKPESELRTYTEYAADPVGRFRQRLARARQTDGKGVVIAETRVEYDHQPAGKVGAEGLVTARSALAITDAQAAAVYGAALPDFAALGYTRRAGTDGWWIELGRYDRAIEGGIVKGRTTGPRGGVTEIDFDPSGSWPVRVRDMAGNELRAEYDARVSQPVALVEPSGERSTARFDALARLVAKVLPGDSEAEPTLAWSYDASTLPLSVTVTKRTADGTAPRIEREFIDGAGRLLERRLGDGAGAISETRNVYGARGLVVRSHGPAPAGAVHVAPVAAEPHTAIHYDALGRPTRTVRPDGAVSTARYLPGVIEEADEEDSRAGADAPHAGTITRRLLDAAGRVERIEQRLGADTLASTDRYDLKGRRIEHIDAAGFATRFSYDLLGHLLAVERPESHQVAVWDASGNNVETRSGASTVRRRFDLANRPLEVRHGTADSAPVARYQWHDAGAPPPADAGTHTAGGRLVRIDDESGSLVLDYDARGRLARRTLSADGQATLVLAISHRADDLIDSVTYPGGTVARYRYDGFGRLAALDGVIDAIEYDLTGRRSQLRLANGTTQDDAHDALTGWRTHSKLAGPGGVLRELGYEHDKVGNVTALTSADAALAWTYRYDDLYRLVEATGAGGTTTYAYDAAGNLAQNSALGAYAYGGAGVPANCLASAGPDHFGYDDRGNVASAPWGTHSHDAEGRLRRIDLAAGGHEEYVYDHAGRLARRRRFDAGGAMTSDVWSPDPLLRVEDGTPVLQFSDGQRTVARERAGQRQWLHVDHLGSLVLVTDAAGAVQLRLDYGPWGEVIARSGPAVVPGGFATGEALGAGLVLLGARWYSPRHGRFLSPDPLVTDAADPLAWNAYAYCRCNPTSYVDPSGRSFWKIFAAVVATIAIIAIAVVVSVFTFGIAAPGMAALTVGGLSVTWGAVFAATMVGIAAGGLIGGIAAARAGGDAGDIVLGALVGGAVGGWAAFGAAFAGVGVAGGLGMSAGVGAGAVAGGVSGAINGAAMGFASGFAGGKNNGFKDVMEKVLVGAIVGAAIGAALGALSGIQAPKESVRESVSKALEPQAPPAQGPASQALPPSMAGGGLEQAPVTSFGDAAAKVGAGIGGKVAGAVAPHLIAPAGGFFGSVVTQTVLVDLSAAAASAFWDDIQEYVRTHQVNLGPFDFVKQDF